MKSRSSVLLLLLMVNVVLSDAIKVNDNVVTSNQDLPAIAMHPNGPTVICWQDGRNDGLDIYFQLFGRKGAMNGVNRMVNDVSDSSAMYPFVDMSNQGHFVITWNDKRSGNVDVYYQYYTANGTPVGENIQINDDDTEFTQMFPVVDFAKDGSFVISWSDARNGEDFDIYAQRFSSDREPIGKNFLVNQSTQYLQIQSRIAVSDSGNFCIVWQHSAEGSGEIYARIFNKEGTPVSSEFVVSTHLDSSLDCWTPDVAVLADGRFGITWTSGSEDPGREAYISVYDANANRLIGPERISTLDEYEYVSMSRIAAHPEWSVFEILWLGFKDSNWGLYSDDIAPDMAFSPNPYHVCDFDGGYFYFDITLAHLKNSIYVWQDGIVDELDIFADWNGEKIPMRMTFGTGFDGVVPISWEPPYGYQDVEKYNIYRMLPGISGPEKIETVDPSLRILPNMMLDYIDTTAENGQEYVYSVEMDGSGAPAIILPDTVKPQAGGHKIRSQWASTVPNINGIPDYDLEEWKGAIPLNIKNPDAQDMVVLIVMNDDDNLYLAVYDANDFMLDPGNALGILFDEDGDGRWEHSLSLEEGMIRLTNASTQFSPFLGEYPNGMHFGVPKVDDNIEFAVENNEGHIWYEARISLKSSTLKASAGDDIKAAIWIEDPGTFYGNGYGNSGEWPLNCLWDSALPLGTITLATHKDTIKQYDWPMVHGNPLGNNWLKDEDVLYPPLNTIEYFADAEYGVEVLKTFGHYLIVGYSNDPVKFTVFDINEREILWSFEPPGSKSALNCIPATDGNVVVFGAQQALGLYGLDLATGEELWLKPMGSLHLQNPVIDDGRVYICNDSLYCLDLENGETIWSHDNEYITRQMTPVVDKDFVYYNTGRKLLCFDTTVPTLGESSDCI